VDVNSEEYLNSVMERREALELRLVVIMASAVPQRVKTMRIRQVTQEAIALRKEVGAAIQSIEGQQS